VTNAQEFVVHRLKETLDIAMVRATSACRTSTWPKTAPPLAVMLIFGGMLSALQNGESLEPMLKALARGFQMGLEDELGSPANSRRARSGRCKSGARSRS
jgi:ubiquinone biosynthesis protein COQ4